MAPWWLHLRQRKLIFFTFSTSFLSSNKHQKAWHFKTSWGKSTENHLAPVIRHTMCLGHFKFWKDFRSTPGSRSPFPVETSGFHWDMAGRGTLQQSRPMCPHIRRTLPTTHHLVRSWFNSVLTHWHWDSLLDFVQVQLKLWTQGFLSS